MPAAARERKAGEEESTDQRGTQKREEEAERTHKVGGEEGVSDLGGLLGSRRVADGVVLDNLQTAHHVSAKNDESLAEDNGRKVKREQKEREREGGKHTLTRFLK